MFRTMSNLKIGVSYLITFPQSNFTSVYTLLRSHDPVERHDPLYTFLDKHGNKVTFTRSVFQQMTVVEWTVHEPKAHTEDAYVSISMPDWSASASAATAASSAASATASATASSPWPDLPPVPSHLLRQSQSWLSASASQMPPVPPHLRLPSQQLNFRSAAPQPVSLADYLKEKPVLKLAELSDDELYG